jgi:hypothetical protein
MVAAGSARAGCLAFLLWPISLAATTQQEIPAMRVYVSATLTGTHVKSIASRHAFIQGLPAAVASAMHGIDKEHIVVKRPQYSLNREVKSSR